MSWAEPMRALLLLTRQSTVSFLSLVEIEPTETDKAISFTCGRSKDERAHISQSILQKILEPDLSPNKSLFVSAHIFLTRSINFSGKGLISSPNAFSPSKSRKGITSIHCTGNTNFQNERTHGPHEAIESCNFQDPLIRIIITSRQGIKILPTSDTTNQIIQLRTKISDWRLLQKIHQTSPQDRPPGNLHLPAHLLDLGEARAR